MGYAKWLLRTVLKEGHWLVIDEVPPFIFGLLVSGAYIYNKSAGIFFPMGS